jgi:hypothetical protein
MFANVHFFSPGPEEHRGVMAMAVWGVCLALATTFGGLSFLIGPPSSRWRPRLRLAAVLLVLVACGLSVREINRP